MALTQITPIFASLTSDESSAVNDTTEQASALKTSALDNGITYAVFWSAQYGGNDNAAVCEATIKFGASSGTAGTVLGYSAGEGREAGFTPNSIGGSSIQGFTLVTGNGSDVVKATFRCQTASDQIWFGAGYILCIPLTGLVQNRDFFFRGNAEDGTLQLTNATTGAFQTIDTVDFALANDATDYIVFMSTEGHSGEGAATESARVKFSIEGTQFGDMGGGDPFKAEWETDEEWDNFVWCGIRSLSGIQTFLAEGRSEGQAESDYRRTRFLVLKKSLFDHVESAVNTAGADSNPIAYTSFASQTYIPAQQEYVLIFASLVPGNQVFSRRCAVRLRDTTNGVNLVADRGHCENQSAIADGKDMKPLFLIGTKEISASTTFNIDYIRLGTNGNVSIGRNDDHTLGIESNFMILGASIDFDEGVPGPIGGGIIPIP